MGDFWHPLAGSGVLGDSGHDKGGLLTARWVHIRNILSLKYFSFNWRSLPWCLWLEGLAHDKEVLGSISFQEDLLF